MSTREQKTGLMVSVKEGETFTVLHGGEALVVTQERRHRLRFNGPKAFAIQRPNAIERAEANRISRATPDTPTVALLNEAARLLADGGATAERRIELARRLRSEAGGKCPVCASHPDWEDAGGRGCPLCRTA